jgi:hypothetical protein
MARPEAPTRPEQPILDEAFDAWLDLLRKESARRAGEHELWRLIHQGFNDGVLAERAQERFQQLYREFQAGLAQEVERTSRGIYEELAKRPLLLNGLRTGKLAIDAAAIGATILQGGIGVHDIILVPLVASVTHHLVEWLGKEYVDSEREKTRGRQQAILHELFSTPMAEWLARWPATGGSAFERLQLALTRLPGAIASLDTRVRKAAQ